MEIVFENSLLTQMAIFLAVAGLIIAAGFLADSRDRAILHRIRDFQRHKDRASDAHPLMSPGQAAEINKSSASLFLSDERQRSCLRARLAEAGIYNPFALGLYVGARVFFAVVLATGCFASLVVLGTFRHHALILSIPAGVLGFGLPFLWLERRRAKRRLVLRRAIPDFLDLVVACLSGGLSVHAALKQVAEELKPVHPELCEELTIMLREIELGGTLDRALEQLAVRTGVEEMKILRSFIQQTVKFGATLADALGQMAEMLRFQREQRAEEMAQKAAVKILFPTMLFIFPTVFVILAGPAAIQIQESLLTNQQHIASSK